MKSIDLTQILYDDSIVLHVQCPAKKDKIYVTRYYCKYLHLLLFHPYSLSVILRLQIF